MPALRALRSRQVLPAGLGRLLTRQQQQHQSRSLPLQRFAAQNKPGQSQRRSLASHTGPTTPRSAGTPPPPRSEEGLSNSSVPVSLPAAATNPSTAQLLPGSSSLSRTAQIARHLQARRYTTSTMASQYTVRKVGAPNTLDHRVYIEKDGVPVSPFHDIPLFANQEQTILNMIVEIPRWTNAKLEVRPLRLFADSCVCVGPRELIVLAWLDLQGRAPQPHQAGHQEGQAPLRPQLLPPQGLPVELRCLPPGM
jgi:inorganic pyrophosphatase